MRISAYQILTVVLLFSLGCSTQTEGLKNNIHITVEGNESLVGFLIMAEDRVVPLASKDIKSRFTPTIEDALEAEKILKNNLGEYLSTDSTFAFIGYETAIFTDHLDNYMRQYAGFVNLANEKEIFINFLPYSNVLHDAESLEEVGLITKIEKENYGTNWLIYHDGGHNFWRIKVNLKRRELHDWDVNGEG